MTHLDQKALTRPIIGIENRTPQEAFDIMCHRITAALAALPQAVAVAIGGQSLAHIAELADTVRQIYAGARAARTSELLEVAQVLDSPAVSRETETQASIGKWADATFGVVTDLPRAVERAAEEMVELKDAITTLSPAEAIVEMADVVIVLMRLADVIGQDLGAAIDAKMAINRKRVWRTDGTGHGYHVKLSEPSHG